MRVHAFMDLIRRAKIKAVDMALSRPSPSTSPKPSTPSTHRSKRDFGPQAFLEALYHFHCFGLLATRADHPPLIGQDTL